MIIDFHVHMLDEHVFRASTNKTVFSGFDANPRPGARLELCRRWFQRYALWNSAGHGHRPRRRLLSALHRRMDRNFHNLH